MNDLRLLLKADKGRKIINLQFKQISNLQLMLPIIKKFESLESLSLNGNRLQSLPEDLSCLDNLTELDISNNLFKDVTDLLPSLKSLPRLTHLLYSCKDGNQERLLEQQLPYLQRINKKPINRKGTTKKSQQQGDKIMRLNEKDLQDIAKIYDEIREIYRKSKYFIDKELADDFDKNVDNIMSDFSNRLLAAASKEEVDTSIVVCRYGLIDLCFTKLITYFYHFDKNIAMTFETIHDYIAESFQNMAEILKTSTDQTRLEVAKVVTRKEDLYKAEIKRLKAIQQTYLSEISVLQHKNAELLDKITKYSKNKVMQITVGSAFKRPGKSPGKAKDTDVETRIANKTLTLNQLKEVMTEIYISKAKHTAICKQTKQPVETLEAHMYTYLNQKYGLKPITVEWAMSIVNGIRKYGSDDAEVAAFGKMLRSEIEEQFAEVLRKQRMNVRANAKKFKEGSEGPLTMHEAEQVLLFTGMKRATIDIILSKVKQETIISNSMSIGTLQQLVLDNLLRGHTDKVKPLVLLFKEADNNDDGLINQDQLGKIVTKIDIKRTMSLEQFMELIDPHDCNSITFSQLCTCVLDHPELQECLEA